MFTIELYNLLARGVTLEEIARATGFDIQRLRLRISWIERALDAHILEPEIRALLLDARR